MMIFISRPGRTITLVAFITILLAGGAEGPLLASGQEQGSLTGISISFKMDPRLSGGGTYGGERWLSGPTYIGANAQNTVEARVEGIDEKGQHFKTTATWTPSDPGMVEVSPAVSNQVKITVKRAGESKLKVTAQGISRELLIKARSGGPGLQVEITQLGAEQPAKEVSQETSELKSQKEKISYAIGMNLGSHLRKQSVEVDAGVLVRGFNDAFSGGRTAMTEEEAQTTLARMQTELTSLQAAMRKELAEKNKREGEVFLAENKKKDGVVTLPSGLQYKILKAGEGKKPAANDTVVIHYRGTLLDGREFASSYKGNRPGAFSVQGVLKGWAEALQLMPVGSRWQLFVPPHLAYGDRGLPRSEIGPNSTLLFEIELISIEKPGKKGKVKK